MSHNQEFEPIEDLSNYNVVVSGTDADWVKPKLDIDSLKLSKSTGTIGDTLTYTVKMADDRGISQGLVNLFHPATGERRDAIFTLNEETGLYEAEIEIDNQFESGTWVIESIFATDLSWNEDFYYNSHVYDGFDNSVDLSAFNLTITGTEPDRDAPVIDLANLEVSTKQAQFDEYITYSIPVSDKSTNPHGEIELRTKDSEYPEYAYTTFTYNEEKNVYEATFHGSRELLSGTWEIARITFTDDLYNRSILFNQSIYQLEEDAVDFSAYEVVVDAVEGEEAVVASSVSYSTHIQSIGWQDAVKDGTISGTVDKSLRLEAIKIHLENLPYAGNVEYQTHVQSYGWLDWAKNGEPAGTEGLAKRLEAIEIRLVEKGKSAPGKTDKPYVHSNPVVSYTTHVQKEGWQDYVSNGQMAGTEGKALRLEALKMKLKDEVYAGGIEYRTHIQSIGWQDWKANDQLSGTEGKALRLEALGIRLTDEIAKHYDVYYRVHAQGFGWLDWAKNGESAGTEGLALRLEGLEVQLVKKDGAAPGKTARPYVLSNPKVNYTTHVQKVGWQNTVSNGAMSGTSGRALRLEGILMNVHTQSLTGGIQYRTHVQKEGWQDWKENWQLSGTQGKALRLEAIEIRLTEEMAKYYDVYYRVHAQSYGWLGWAKNGESAGTEGLAKRLEGIEVKLVRKGQKAPGSTQGAFVKR